MKKFMLWMGVLLLTGSLAAGTAVAQEDRATDRAVDITKEVIMGPGSVGISTTQDILMSFGARTRIIPTAEGDWDFGISDDWAGGFLDENRLTIPAALGLVPTDDVNDDGVLTPQLPSDFFKIHANESGWLNGNYIRNETQIYFNALPKDRAWSFYAALEYDRPLETASVDERGGKSFQTSNFGLERLHGTFRLPMNMRLHAGYDIWGVDVIDAAGLVYGDDNPGFWLTGDYDTFSFNVGYFKLGESNFQVFDTIEDFGDKDDDRDLYAGYMTFNPSEGQKIQPFYTFDRIRSVPVGNFLQALTGQMGAVPDTNVHHIGAYYTGDFGLMELFLEGVYEFGEAEDTGLAQGDFDVSAYAFSADLAFNLDDIFGFGVKPHIGGIYTSGDDDPTDDELNGYTGVENAQRFSQYFGGENTIIGDTNFILGSVLYGFIPELYGNGTPVFTGGLQNFAGFGSGRGDNPGMTMSSVGITLTPKRFLIFRTNVNSFWWNEDISVPSFVDFGITNTQVDSGYTGTEWDNELTLATSKNSFIKGQFAFFFPGEVIEDVTSARTAVTDLTTGVVTPGPESDEMAYRLALEFIWMF